MYSRFWNKSRSQRTYFHNLQSNSTHRRTTKWTASSHVGWKRTCRPSLRQHHLTKLSSSLQNRCEMRQQLLNWITFSIRLAYSKLSNHCSNTHHCHWYLNLLRAKHWWSQNSISPTKTSLVESLSQTKFYRCHLPRKQAALPCSMKAVLHSTSLQLTCF